MKAYRELAMHWFKEGNRRLVSKILENSAKFSLGQIEENAYTTRHKLTSCRNTV